MHYLKIMRELEFGKSYIQSCLVILLPKYFISFLSKQNMHTISNLKSLKRYKLGENNINFIFRGELPYKSNKGKVEFAAVFFYLLLNPCMLYQMKQNS